MARPIDRNLEYYENTIAAMIRLQEDIKDMALRANDGDFDGVIDAALKAYERCGRVRQRAEDAMNRYKYQKMENGRSGSN